MIPGSPIYPRSSLGVVSLHLLWVATFTLWLTDLSGCCHKRWLKLPSGLNYALTICRTAAKFRLGKTSAESVEELKGKEAQRGSESLELDVTFTESLLPTEPRRRPLVFHYHVDFWLAQETKQLLPVCGLENPDFW